MANAKYAQVIDLLAGGRLHWQRDPIVGILVAGTEFDAFHQRLSDVGTPIATTEIQGRYLHTGGVCLGYPAFFNVVPGDVDYQMILAKDEGDGNPFVLAWFDTDGSGGPLRLANTGTLVVRPAEVPDPYPVGMSDSFRVWMRL